MATADTSIYGNLLRPAPSLMDNVNALDAADLQRTQLADAKVNLIGQQQSLADRQAVRALYQRPGFDPSTPQGLADLSAASPSTALATRKAMLDNAKIQADTVRAQGLAPDQVATTAKTATETRGLKADQDAARTNRHLQKLVTVSDVPSAVGWINDAVASGELPMQQATQVISALQSGQIPLSDWKQKAMAGGLTLQQQREANQKDAVQAETFRHNAADEANTVRGQNMTAQTARQNNAATITKDYRLGGYDANGNLADIGLGVPPGAPAAAPGGPSAPAGAPAPAGTPPAAAKSPFAGLVDSIGQYKTPEGVALGRVPPAIKSQVLAAVMQQYPDYDPSTFGAKQKAAKDFTSGTQGNALRSFAVAGQHLDQLGTLVDALDNGQYPIVNKIANTYAQQTGSTAPTNFDAAKDVVSKEVTKAIVAGGGGVSERAELANLMSNAKTPQQLKGVITQYRGLMSAQHDALLQQRHAAGLPDSTLPDYGDSSPTGAPKGAFTITHVNGQPQ